MGVIEKTLSAIFDAQYKSDFGQKGVTTISDTNLHVGNWIAIKADGAADAVFNTLTTSKGDSLDGLTLLAGDIIYGPFVSIDLTSGTIYAYIK